MGLLDMLLPGTNTSAWASPLGLTPVQQPNPFAQWFDQNRNTLTSGLAGLTGATNLHDALGGLSKGVTDPNAHSADQAYQQAIQQQQVAAQQVAAEQAKQNKTIQWLKQNAPKYADAVANGAMSAPDAWKAAMTDANGTTGADPSDVATYKFYANQEKQAGRQPKTFAEWFAGSKQATKSGLGQPIWGKDPTTGEYVAFSPMTDGSLNPLSKPNADPSKYVFDPGTVASDKAAGGAYGAAQGTGQYNLPAAKQNIDVEMANIDAILNDPKGLDEVFGKIGGIYPQQWSPVTVPGSPKANIQERIKQVVGENFLQAYASLKGAGAITEVEGGKAQDAMARMSSAQSQDAFTTALNDLKTILQTSYARMSGQATMGPYQSTGYTPPPLAGQNYKVLGVE